MREKLFFYIADTVYIDYLRKEEESKRGFSRVPKLNYAPNQKRKFFCGVVLNVNDFDYFVPVSSYKKQERDNFLICNTNGQVLSSLRFNYMVPISLSVLSLLDIKNEPDQLYKSLLEEEYQYCNQHKDNILRLASRTYKRVLLGKDLGLVHNSCDFKFLEEKCLEYQEILENSESINYEFYLNLSDKTLDR